MAQVTILPAAEKTCKAAVLPVTHQEPEVVFDTATDGTAPTIIGPIAAGAPAPHGGTFINRGCEDLIVEITYINGGNCEPCDDPDTLTAVTIPWTIYANTQADIPEGFWSVISYTLSAAANDNKLQRVSFQSCYTPDCPDCTVFVPAEG